MLEVICARDGTVHHADEAHVGKLVKCASCGDALRIGSVVSKSPLKTEKEPAKVLPGKSPLARKNLSWKELGTDWRVVIAALLMTLVCASFAFRHRIQTKSQNPQGVITSVRSNPSAPAIAPAPPNRSDAAHLDRFLPNGTKIRCDFDPHGKGILTIENSTSSAAVVKVLSLSSGKAVRMIFVSSLGTVDLRNLRPGLYRVFFTFGEGWDNKSLSFTRPSYYYRFGKDLSFEEIERSDSIRYSHESITLNPSFDGNVPRVAISKEEFDRL